MLLSEAIREIGYITTVFRDGHFHLLEQCTRIRGADALTYLENAKFIPFLNNPNITCVICTPEIVPSIPSHVAGVFVTELPKLVFFQLHNLKVSRRIKKPTQIDPTATINSSAYIAPYNVIIGPNVEIGPLAVVHENSTVCRNVYIGSGTIVGGQSFTAVKDGHGGIFLAKDAGNVLIEEGVEICSNCHIACGTLEKDTTTLGSYTKLDAMVHVGHGTTIGKRTLIPAGVTLSGNCSIGDDVWIGVGATVSNRITISNKARVSLGSVVTKDVPAGTIVTGNFAIDHQKFLKNLKMSVKDDTNSGEMPPPCGHMEMQ